MGNALFWSNVGIDVQTAMAAAIPISNISKASPAVCTYTGATNPTAGDIIVVTSNGMSEVNDRPFRVANVNTGAKTFELEGEDSTAYGSHLSGSFQVATLGATMTIAQNVNVSGGEAEMTDTTTIHDLIRKRAPTVLSPLSLAIDGLFDLTDPAFKEMNKAYKSKTKRLLQLRFGTGARMLLVGYCSASGVPTGQAQGVVQMKLGIEAQNVPTVYAT